MNNVVLGILAHVDAGKTTTAEALLYKSGSIRRIGRVDHKDAFLDNFLIEKERGITIFSKQAIFDVGNNHFNLLDTPGHMDFSAEMERTLSVLDYALLVISGQDGVQAHTLTLWELLKRYRVPCIVWVNKKDLMEASGKSLATLLEDLKLHFGEGFVDFNNLDFEKIAELDENALTEFLDRGTLSKETVCSLIDGRKLFPCLFGSALRLEGVDELISFLSEYISEKKYSEEFGAKVFKISHDESGQRLSWIKLCGGALKPKDTIDDEKINQIRAYSGVKFEAVGLAEPGNIYALCGLEKSFAGQGLGFESAQISPVLEPVLSYRIIPPAGVDSINAMKKLSLLAEEDPMLRIVYNSRLKEIEARLMGQVQIDVLKDLIYDRYGMNVEIDTGHIVYKETIAAPVLGIGHFEPLRHYAEVHLLMEPLAPGSGIELCSACSTDTLDLNWQRLILTNLAEKEHLGVIIGAPITDIRITIVAGRAHLKHTEGGDFRQAVYRAVRQGLMSAENVLLEPYYDYCLEIPAEHIGRAISDCKAMSCSFDAPKDMGMNIQIKGRGPVSELQNYQLELLSYTKGRGRISCSFAGHFPCHNTEKIAEESAYDPDRDVENTADSVFCSHGAGVNVKWNKVPDFAHLDSGISFEHSVPEISHSPKLRSGNIDFDEKELQAIMQREFGEPKRPQIASVTVDFGGSGKKKQTVIKKDYLIVDAYNMIFSWPELKELAKASMDAARARLTDMLINYRAFKNNEVCLIFDGYKRKDNLGAKEDDHGIHIVYTKEGESADAFIEALVREIGKNYSVRVATSDGLIQLTALRAGVIRMSSKELEYELEKTLNEISAILQIPRKKITLADIARLKKI